MRDTLKKTIAIVPPGGKLLYQDFALMRMCDYLKTTEINTCLLAIKDENLNFESFTDFTIEMKDEDELITQLQNGEFDLIFHRTWMHRYSFAAKLLENFENIVFYIKDWFEEMPREVYKYQFKTDEDYDAIAKLFGSQKMILSHYTDDYTSTVLSKNYDVPSEKFVFFPEYCSKENFFVKQNISYDPKNPKLLYVGIINATTSMPDDVTYGKSFFEATMNICRQNIKLDMMVLEKNYNRIQTEPIFSDYLYEDRFNDYFSLVRGRALNMSVTNDYHFGIFQFLSPIDKSRYLKSTAYAYVSKFAYFMEAGIPIIVHESFSIAQLVETQGIGIVVKAKDVLNLKKLLDITEDEYLQLVANVYRFRESFTYNDETMRPILEFLDE